MAFKLPPEKSGWLGPEEHFSDTGDISDDATYQPAVKSPLPRDENRPVETKKTTNTSDIVDLNLNQRHFETNAFQSSPPENDPYVVGYVARKENVAPRGFVSYPVDVTDDARRDGSVVPNDKHRDAFVYQTTMPIGFEKTAALPTLDPIPKVDATVLEKTNVQSRGAHNQKYRQRAKTTTCFGNRGESEGSFYYIVTPKKREQTVQEPISIIDVERYKSYENETPLSRNASVVSPISGQTTYQNREIFDGTQIANNKVSKSNNIIQSILKKPIEHLPHTHFPKLSSLSPIRPGNHDVFTAVGTEQKPKIIEDGQVFSSHSVRFSNDIAMNRAEVQASSAFSQNSRGTNPQEFQERNVTGTARPSTRSTSPSRLSWRTGKSPGRGRSTDRVQSPYQFAGRRKETARKNDLFIIDEEVHATNDSARDAVAKGTRSDLSSGAKRVIVGRVSSPRRSRDIDLSCQTSDSALSTKRKRKEHRNTDGKSVADAVFYENVCEEQNECKEQVRNKSDWTGLNTYQAHRVKFEDNQKRLDLVSPDICAIRQTKVQTSFETTPLVYATSSTEKIACHNVVCKTRQRRASQDKGETDKDCFDRLDSPRKRESRRLSRPASANKENCTAELPLKVIFKRPPSIKKKFQTDCAPDKSREVRVNTLIREKSHPESYVNNNCDIGVKTHFENPPYRASNLSRHRASLDVGNDEHWVADDDVPTIEELNERFYTPASVLPTPAGKDHRFYDQPPEKPCQQTKETQTVFRGSSPGPQPVGKTQKFFNIVGPSSKARNTIVSQAGCRSQLYDGKQRPFPRSHRFDESQPYEHVYSDSIRVLPDFQSQQLYNPNARGQNLNVNHCEAYNRNFENDGNRDFYKNSNGWGDQDNYRDYDGYGSPNEYSPDEHGIPNEYSPDEYGNADEYSPDEYGNADEYCPDEYSPDEHGNADEYKNGASFPPPVFVGKPLGQTNNNQVVEGAWDFMKNMFRKKKFRNAAYNKRAEVSCGDCGNGMRFTLSVGMQDGAGCLVCYNRVRDDFTELLNVYKEKGYLPCDCKKALCVTELVNGYMAQEKVVCTCIGDAFIDLGK